MKIKSGKITLLCILFSSLFVLNPLHAQLNTVFIDIFERVLGDENGEGGALIPVPSASGGGTHAQHFIDASIEASGELTDALTSLIAGDVSSFPLSSTAAGVTFDFSTGQPVSIIESLGPIFAETGKTLGKNRVNLGLNYTFLDLAKFRGLRTEEMQFAFTHEDVGVPGLGDSPNESDVLNIKMNVDVNASISAFFGTVGITENLDIGLAIPIITVDMSGSKDAVATINSFTFINSGKPNHHFGSFEQPELEKSFAYKAENIRKTGVGDITLRAKYSFAQGPELNFAALIDTRLPTGNKNNFLGTGKASIRVLGILSKKIGDFTPHLNMGYDYRAAKFDSDEFEFALGFDQKIISGLTFAMDILGEVDLNKNEVIKLLPEPQLINDTYYSESGDVVRVFPRVLKRSNIPERENDNVFNLSVGFRFAPSQQLILLANTLISMNDGGLRSSLIPTVGLAFSF